VHVEQKEKKVIGDGRDNAIRAMIDQPLNSIASKLFGTRPM